MTHETFYWVYWVLVSLLLGYLAYWSERYKRIAEENARDARKWRSRAEVLAGHPGFWPDRFSAADEVFESISKHEAIALEHDENGLHVTVYRTKTLDLTVKNKVEARKREP